MIPAIITTFSSFFFHQVLAENNQAIRDKEKQPANYEVY